MKYRGQDRKPSEAAVIIVLIKSNINNQVITEHKYRID